jgi:voltage-gated sodium channel
MDWRTRLGEIMEGPTVRNGIISVILFNAVLLGMETSPALMAEWGTVIRTLDRACLAIFTVEIALKLLAFGFRFFRSGWNVFDFVIVGVALIPGAQTFSVLRAMRVLRILRLISVAPQLRRVVEGFIRALPGMASVFLLMAIIFYVGAVMATKLFAASFPELFGTLGRSAYTLFQVMTLEGWSDAITRPVMEVYPYAWAFFIPFIMVTTFAVVNLLVGLVVNAMQEAADDGSPDTAARNHSEVLERLRAIELRLAAGEKERV